MAGAAHHGPAPETFRDRLPYPRVRRTAFGRTRHQPDGEADREAR